jgi:hypothetical protein
MPLCGKCYYSNKHKISIGSMSDSIFLEAISCDMCLNWDASKDSELGYFKPPASYPCRENMIGGKDLKEKIITFKGLLNAWNRKHRELVSVFWK